MVTAVFGTVKQAFAYLYSVEARLKSLARAWLIAGTAAGA